MLTITNIHWQHNEFSKISALSRILNNRFKTLNLAYKIQYDELIDGLRFNDINATSTFLSSKDNKIQMRPGDARIAKLKRDYLLSKRPTEKQFFGFFDTIQKTFDELGLKADIELVVTKTNERYVIRDGFEKFNNYPQIKSFPIDL